MEITEKEIVEKVVEIIYKEQAYRIRDALSTLVNKEEFLDKLVDRINKKQLIIKEKHD